MSSMKMAKKRKTSKQTLGNKTEDKKESRVGRITNQVLSRVYQGEKNLDFGLGPQFLS